MEHQATNHNGGAVGAPEMSPVGPLPRKQPPTPISKSANTINATSSNNNTQSQMYLFENLPRGISASDGESSTFSLPNVPSPLSGPSPSITNLQQRRHEPNHQQTQDHHRTPKGQGHHASRRSCNDEEDTFYDDRSLEHRIQRTLKHAPRPMHYMDTPSSVPITPTGPSSTRGHSQSFWNAPAASHMSQQQRKQQQQHPATVPRMLAADNIDTADNIDDVDDKLMSHRASMAILKLKTDLRNAVNQNYLIQQEKEAAQTKARDLKRNYEQLLHDKQAADERATSSDQERLALEQAKQQLTQQVQATTSALETTTADKHAREMEVQQLKQEVETFQKENQELLTRMRSLIREHQEDLTTFNDSTEGRLSRLREELDAALTDNETLRSSLAEANQKASEKTNELEHEKEKSQADLMKMTEKHDTCIRQMEQFESVVQTAKEQSEERIRTLESQQQELKAKQESDQIEIIRLRNALKEASKESGKAYANNSKAENEAISLRQDNEAQQNTIDDMKTALQDANKRVLVHREELRIAQEHLQQAQADNDKHLAEIQRLGFALEEAKQTSPGARAEETPLHATTSQNVASDVCDSILDRLARIRDAAERASLVKDHHREMARLKDQYESKIKNLSTRLQQRLEDSMSSVKTELVAKHTVTVEALQSDFDAKLATIERRHQEEIETVSCIVLICIDLFCQLSCSAQCVGHFLQLKEEHHANNSNNSSIASSQGKPIQERYQHCSVLLADVAGFTQWCSEREPCHVFQLLEAIFFAFDTVAKSLKVYKIETIGDCYVRTGLDCTLLLVPLRVHYLLLPFVPKMPTITHSFIFF